MLLYVDAQYVSPYAMSVFVALTEKAVPFQIETVDLGRNENRHSAYTDVSLTQRVPTLVHGGFSLSESSAITEYLDETLGGTPLYPKEPRARARAREIQAWLRSDLMPIRRERSTEVVFYGRKGTPLTADAQAAAAKLFSAASALLANGSGNVLGTWCIADLDLALMLNRLIMHGDPVPPPLAAYAERQWARSSVQLWVKRERPPLPG